jgi:hypothetical protein
MKVKNYKVEVEMRILAQSFFIVVDAEGVDEEDAARDAEEYVRDNISISSSNVEEDDDE